MSKIVKNMQNRHFHMGKDVFFLMWRARAKALIAFKDRWRSG